MSMLMRLPKHIPPLDVLLYSSHNPTPAALAKAMGVTEKTAKRWIAKNEAPKPVMLALFWLTKWGMQWLDADLYNEAQLHFAMNRCQARQLREVNARLKRVARLGNFGCANDPAEGVELPGPGEVKPMVVVGRAAKRRPSPDGHASGLIRERVCRPPNSFHHFMQKKRRSA